jgi:Tfp pilus assembly protein PilN
MDRISQDLPDLVWLDHMSLGPGSISLNGRGLNPNAIANFIDNIKHDPMFEEPAVGNLTMVSAAPLVYAFDMNFHYTNTPKDQPAPGTPGAATTTTGTTSTSGTAAPGTPGGGKP